MTGLFAVPLVTFAGPVGPRGSEIVSPADRQHRRPCHRIVRASQDRVSRRCCQAAGEQFNPRQAEKLAAALGYRAIVRSFTAAEWAAYHSHIRAFVLMNGVVLDWVTKVLPVNIASACCNTFGPHDGSRSC